jgi:hypothetical protein
MSEQPPEQLEPAERRLLALIVQLAEQPARPDPAFVAAVMRVLRWQLLVRHALATASDVSSALGGTVAGLLGVRTRGGRR